MLYLYFLDGSFDLKLSLCLCSEKPVELVVDLLIVHIGGQVVEAVLRVLLWDSRGVNADHSVIEHDGAATVSSKRRKLVLELPVEELNKGLLFLGV